ncbi:MAG TPA: tripartite tricarboxylate transporter substrate binding protein [Burkholderiales bacterium]|nr:tripartite tricarboxylate transporter substrate binding protein [Burkholderiales bacterium]
MTGKHLTPWLGAWFAGAALFACASDSAFAQTSSTGSGQGYPNQPVKILLPYAAGGVADISARVLAQRLSETMRQQFIIDNRPSAGQIVASEAVRNSEPDGYTLLWINQGHAVSVSLFIKLPYDPVKDFAPVSTVGYFGIAMVVDSASPYNSVKEFIAAAKAKPGKFNVGTTSIGSTQYVSAELFKAMAGLDFQTVPFKATPMIITAVKGKDLDAMFEILAPVIPHVKSGNLKALAVTFDHRFAGLPDVPTLAEAGVPGYEASAWNGVAAPAKTPRAIVDRLNREINDAVAVPQVKQRLQDLGVDARGSTPEGLRDLLVSEIGKWRKVVEAAKIEKQ